jgi:uncharacterized protein (TIRG00374 family)
MKRSTSLFLRIAVALILLAVVITFADWAEIWGVLKTVDIAWILGALALAFADRLIINQRWQALLVALGIRRGFWSLFRIQLAANFAGSFLPSSLGVDALRITALVRAGLATAPVFAATLVDRFSLVLASLLFGSAMLLMLAGTKIPPDVAHVVFAVTAAGVLACAFCLYPPVRRWVRERLLPLVPAALRNTAHGIANAALAYRHRAGTVAVVVAITLALFFVRILFAKTLGLACGIDIRILDLLLVIPLLWIMVMLPITIGSIGIQEASYVVLMGLIGVDPAIAVSMSLIEHVVSRLASLPGLLFVGDFVGSGRKEEAGPLKP